MIDVPSFADLNLGAAAPVFFLSIYTTVLLMVDVLFIPKDRKKLTAQLTLLALAIAFVMNLFVFDSGETALGDMFIAPDHHTANLATSQWIRAKVQGFLRGAIRLP